ncbi:phosphoenolpyruvate--protein phosphotransferase [Agarivorans sp. B2Z047]|uniref:phosphoenolpyruvate--protein phosphotransferase n=1 Tax=Agarivorans sp. B2Z047 TaxID=2652721 RepID=UPI00140667E6|nr:phosphoenolpyruvate--protein phosphotransferase [Agarivorans sp. B2Z047]MPW30774.1 phosphoenolpyruvate--protein phosphotransferase [Agarivorans sp. B2Z047]UQN42004.1 phosphoenolpyruvate--protein phosphotransferase [Agarivorans sp. B2Z047]
MLGELRAIVEQVSNADTLDSALAILVEKIRLTMHTDCCSVYVMDSQQQNLVLRATHGLASEAVGKAMMPLGEGVVGQVAVREEPINLADARLNPHFKYLPETAEDGFFSFLGTPITHQRKVLGVLVVQQSETRSFDQSEESFLVTLAAHLAGVLANTDFQTVLQEPTKHKWTEAIKAGSSSSGIAIAKAWINRSTGALEQQVVEKAEDSEHQLQRFDVALEITRDEFHSLAIKLSEQLPKDVASIFDVYQHMLADASLAGDIRRKISEGYQVEGALRLVIEHYVQQFEEMNDPYLKERAVDVKDVGLRLLHALELGPSAEIIPSEPVIVVAEEVTATMFAKIPRKFLAGVISQRGAANSHAAILARAMGIPALMGLSFNVNKLRGCELILDGYSGELFVEPDKIVRDEYIALLAQESELNSLVQQDLDKPAVSIDGENVEMLINAGLSADSDIAINAGADGVGLYRTEVPFLMQDRFPSEDEQYTRYRDILNSYRGKEVCMRTLDVGGDKQLPYFPIVEENPFLGWRGIRLTLDHPEIFLVQARAMYRSAIECGNLCIMLPMISCLNEVDEASRLLEQAWAEVVDELDLTEPPERPKHGVMLEVPSVLFLLPELAQRVDFWSVGSNDLTQYLLAVDRNNTRVAELFDTFHPSVVRALNQIIEQANLHNTPVSFCGELAGEPVGALLVLALGYRRLSMSSFNLAKIKYIIRHVNLSELAALREQILQSQSGSAIYSLLYEYLQQQNLSQLVRVSKH